VGTAGEQFRLSLGLDLVPIPFNGVGPSTAAVVAGHTPIGFCQITLMVPQIKDGNLRALVVTNKTRSQSALNVPTMMEAGYPNIEGDSWFGVPVPAGTPNNIIASLNREIVHSVVQPGYERALGDARQPAHRPSGLPPGRAGVEWRGAINAPRMRIAGDRR
jgi:tripartite-type tricarboxylate transporter receptor subunit TctC